ncbi:MAG: RNA polymerase factor sigma-54 [Luteimonas sp.]
MKPRLQTSMSQQLVMTPQLRQAIQLLQMSSAELEAEITAAIESNPLLEWVEESAPLHIPTDDGNSHDSGETPAAQPEAANHHDADGEDHWSPGDESWYQRNGPSGDGDEDGEDSRDRVARVESLQDHLLWQLHLSHLSGRDRRIGMALIDAIDDDGYLRESIDAIVDALRPEVEAGHDEILTVLHQIQHFDPVGVGARTLGECLCVQLSLLPDETPFKALARRICSGPIERLPRIGVTGMAHELGCGTEDAQQAIELFRSMDPRPGAQVGGISNDAYVTPDCVVWRQHGTWRVALSSNGIPRISIHRGYEGMIGGASVADAGYLRGRLQEARWLLRSIEARGETLLKVMRCLLRQQAGFLEFGAQALRPLTLREVAGEVGLHESTISRAIARKYVRTPRGTLPLRAFFASGIDTGGGGEASSTAIQAMIRELIQAENPRKPLSDASLAASLKAAGVPVARRTIAKYREAMHVPSSHERVRIA